ncbi:MAG: HD domain-containing protein [Clostridiaceae bacterium]|jgi:putative nucleotidyltransferase with HDIG domain|nr:HD domain-containing protein [Clostridiaceae bacterium]
MTFKIASPLFTGGINTNIRVDKNRYNTGFNNNLPSDRIELNSIGKYTSENAIQKMIKANPNVSKIMKEMNAPMVLNMEELRELEQTHATDIKRTATSIIDNLPDSLKSSVNTKAIQDAAYLHDIGKVLIPKSVLNKPARLTDDEQTIMHKHSQIGYELLKSTDIDPYTLNLVRYHHQNALGTGYPAIEKDFKADINLQILSIADKYSALLEKRIYKESLTPKQALTIIYNQDVKTGKIHPFVFNALIKSANKDVAKNVTTV